MSHTTCCKKAFSILVSFPLRLSIWDEMLTTTSICLGLQMYIWSFSFLRENFILDKSWLKEINDKIVTACQCCEYKHSLFLVYFNCTPETALCMKWIKIKTQIKAHFLFWKRFYLLINVDDKRCASKNIWIGYIQSTWCVCIYIYIGVFLKWMLISWSSGHSALWSKAMSPVGDLCCIFPVANLQWSWTRYSSGSCVVLCESS